MVKYLTRIGNSLGLIIERPILELLNVDESTPLEITTDGDALIIRPLRGTRSERLSSTAKRVTTAHKETLAKLGK